MKKSLNIKKKLSLSKEKLNRLNDVQLNNFMGGRMAMATGYTSTRPQCSGGDGTGCCSWTDTACC